jgi:hypothetical protein
VSEEFQNLTEKPKNTTLSEEFQNLTEKQKNATLSEEFKNLTEKQKIPHCQKSSKVYRKISHC